MIMEFDNYTIVAVRQLLSNLNYPKMALRSSRYQISTILSWLFDRDYPILAL